VNELRNQNRLPLKSGVPHIDVLEPDETRALEEMGRVIGECVKD
jgi:hypothetical protein